MFQELGLYFADESAVSELDRERRGSLSGALGDLKSVSEVDGHAMDVGGSPKESAR